MTHLISCQDGIIRDWIIDKIDYLYRLDKCVVVGVIGDSDKIMAGVAYHDYQPECAVIQMTIAAINPMWAKQRIIKKLLQYPFEQLGCYKVLISVRIDNHNALKVMKKIGFVQEAILAHNFGIKQHAVILRMLKPDYNKLYGADNGQIVASTSRTS